MLNLPIFFLSLSFLDWTSRNFCAHMHATCVVEDRNPLCLTYVEHQLTAICVTYCLTQVKPMGF